MDRAFGVGWPVRSGTADVDVPSAVAEVASYVSVAPFFFGLSVADVLKEGCSLSRSCAGDIVRKTTCSPPSRCYGRSSLSGINRRELNGELMSFSESWCEGLEGPGPCEQLLFLQMSSGAKTDDSDANFPPANLLQATCSPGKPNTRSKTPGR